MEWQCRSAFSGIGRGVLGHVFKGNKVFDQRGKLLRLIMMNIVAAIIEQYLPKILVSRQALAKLGRFERIELLEEE